MLEINQLSNQFNVGSSFANSERIMLQEVQETLFECVYYKRNSLTAGSQSELRTPLRWPICFWIEQINRQRNKDRGKMREDRWISALSSSISLLFGHLSVRIALVKHLRYFPAGSHPMGSRWMGSSIHLDAGFWRSIFRRSAFLPFKGTHLLWQVRLCVSFLWNLFEIMQMSGDHEGSARSEALLPCEWGVQLEKMFEWDTLCWRIFGGQWKEHLLFWAFLSDSQQLLKTVRSS